MNQLARIAAVVGCLSLGFLPAPARAAQTGRIVADEASLREYPQDGSRVIAKIRKGQQITVSNVPTQGFYKARIPTGEVGWISGNEVQVKGAARGQAPSRRKGPSKPEDLRVQLTYGLAMTSLGDMSGVFTTTGFGAKAIGLEGQFRLNDKWFWAVRVESHSGSQAATDITASSATQTITSSLLPVQLGANYTLMQTESLRIGAGLYLGMAVSAATTVSWTYNTGTVEEVKYSSFDPCGALTVGGAYAFSNLLGAVLELGYRYHKTGEFPSTTRFGTKPGFAINYSGITVRGGIELKF